MLLIHRNISLRIIFYIESISTTSVIAAPYLDFTFWCVRVMMMAKEMLWVTFVGITLIAWLLSLENFHDTIIETYHVPFSFRAMSNMILHCCSIKGVAIAKFHPSYIWNKYKVIFHLKFDIIIFTEN